MSVDLVVDTRAEGENPRFVVRQAAVTPVDGPVAMLVNPHPGSQALSASGLYLGTTKVQVEGLSLASLMRELGDAQVDRLKLDIEGASTT